MTDADGDEGFGDEIYHDAGRLDASAFRDYLQTRENVYKAEVVDETTVSAVEKAEFTDDPKTFSGARACGWIVGMVCPYDHGNTYVFVQDGESL